MLAPRPFLRWKPAQRNDVGNHLQTFLAVSAAASRSLSPGVSMEPGLTAQSAQNVRSVTGALRKIHFDIESQQPIEQRHLAIIMPRLEAAVGDLFAAVLQQTKPIP
jgi:hypothetical protein